MMACIVVFCTTYALLLPAVTLEKTAECGLEEHQHEDSCYEDQLVCGQEESGEHRHSNICYQKVFACGKEAHVHSADCFQDKVLESAMDGDFWIDYTGEEAGASILEETGDAGEEAGTSILEETEDAGDTAVNEQAAGSALGLAAEEGSQEVEESAGEAEPSSEETFGETLGENAGATTEQTAPDEMTEAEAAPVQGVAADLACQGQDYEVTVTAGEEAGIPEGASLSVSEIMPETSANNTDTNDNTGTELTYEEYVSRTGEALGLEEVSDYYIRLFDIKIVDSYGEKIKIQAPVDVNIQLTDQEGSNVSNAQIVHFADEADETDITEETNGIEETNGAEGEISGTEEASRTDGEINGTESAYGADSINQAEGTDSESVTTPAGRAKKELKARKTEGVKKAQKAEKAGKEKKADVIQNVTVEAGNLPGDGITLSFKAEGFSVYAVVAAPEMPEIQEEAVASLQELSQNTAEAFYLSVTRSGSVNYFQNELNGSGAFKVTGSVSSAAEWYFEPVQGQANRYRIYTLIDGNRKYIKNTNGNLAGLADSDGTAFDVSMAADRLFYLKMNDQNKWLQYSKGGIGIRFYTDNNNNDNSRVTLTYVSSTELPEDPLGLDGKTYGLMNYSDGLKGQAMMAAAKNNTALTAQPAIVRTDPQDREEKMYIAQNTDISMWTFHAVEGGLYTLSATVDGETKYLKITASGLSLVDEADASAIHVTSGTGANQGKLRLSCTGGAVSFEGTNGFKAADSGNAKEWLHLVEKSSLTDEDFVIRSAVKVSVSDTEKVKDGAQILIYKRVWNDIDKRYEYYAIDQDGGLVPCYESGDSIEWVGTKLNKLLWTFTEGYYEGTTTPNYYYQLYNPYSEKYLFPGIKDGQSLSDEPASVNLNGRRYGDYYTSIIAWDDPYYTYAGLKSEDGRIVSCPMAQAEDFYFAIMQEEEEQDELTEVATVDHTENGITMKIVDFGNKAGDIIKGDGCTTSQEQHDVMGVSKYIKDQVQNLVSTRLDDQGYPVSTTTGRSLADLYAEAEEVNHLFIADIYKGTGYYEFDSTQNFTSLQNDLTFKVYQQLGTIDQQQKPSLKHGQFMPYNDLTPGVYARDNGENLYNAEQQPLPDDDPRKYERLYRINNPDHYFGLELEASFVQTPNGKDAWGHDIIYEFTGDDDFWLYVDGELVINLGGIHGALGGKVNYSTGEAVINGQPTTLYTIFRKNYADRNNLSEDDPAVTQYLDEIFTVNEHGQHVFKDYTSHTMRIFFMERGGGASNLYMRFNLAAVKPDQILLNKKLSGTDKKDYKLAEYPFQIFYKMEEDGDEYQLGPRTDGKYNVTYQNSSTPVPYSPSYRVPGGTSQYSDVFFLGAEDTAAITLPEDAVGYRIVECGLNTQVYDRVSVNEEEVTGQASADTNRKDYSTAYDTMENRRHVSFDNHVNENAIRTLTISKKLFEPDGTTPVEDDDAGFNFRLSLGSENDDELRRASLQEYCVRDAEGNYCRYDPDRQMFLSLEKASFADLTETEKAA